MKKITQIILSFLTIILIVGFIAACEGPEGPKGDPGEDGAPGSGSVVNWEGFKDGIVCGECHNPDIDTTYYVWARKYQWEQSKHFLGGTFATRNNAPCSGCHTTEGLVQRALADFPPQVFPIGWSVVSSQPNSTPVGCFACHSPHSNGDFSLRTESLSGVVIWSPMEGVADQTIDFGKGNMCLMCHQTRGTSFSPKMKTSQGATDTLKITSSRWYPHYGVQGLMYLGVGKGGGFEFPGSSYNNGLHPSLTQIIQQGCPTCHMAEPEDGVSGGHTFNIGYDEGDYNTNGCMQTGCHSGQFDVETYVSQSSSLTGGMGVYEYVEEYLDTLANLLMNKGILGSNGLVQGDNGTSNASSTNPRTFVGPEGLLQAGALYNYYFVEHDESHGIHNSMYTLKLLNDSIDEMKKP